MVAAQDFEVDAASVIMRDAKGHRYRLPKGSDVFSSPAASGWRRGIREVVTERNLMNIHGTFYEMPRDESGGLAKIRPIAPTTAASSTLPRGGACWCCRATWPVQRRTGITSLRTTARSACGWAISKTSGNSGHPAATAGRGANTAVRAGKPSDPYLMTGYEHKKVRLSHDRPAAVRFMIEVDFLANGTWHTYQTLTVAPGQTLTHVFPEGFSAHWVRVTADADCKATAWFLYNESMPR